MEKLRQAHVAVFGIGGVGGYVVEALARSGVGSMDLTDSDTVCLTNLNRQIAATKDTLGKCKVDVMKERILSINPEAVVNIHKCFYLPETAGKFDFQKYDYIVDAVDTVTAKIELVMQAQKAGTPIISCMGTGNKLDPMQLEVADIYETSVCPLARVVRRELKKRGVRSLKVLYSREKPLMPFAEYGSDGQESVAEAGQEEKKRRTIPGSTAFVPPAAGLIIASEVIKDIISWDMP